MKTQAIILGLILGGCAVQKAPQASDQEAKKLIPTTGKAIVYIIRPSIIGGAIRGVINCDNQYVGSVAGMRYIFTKVDPGKHVFTGLAENSSDLELVVESGKTYFIVQRMRFGYVYARNKLNLLNEDDGRRKLARCKLAVN